MAPNELATLLEEYKTSSSSLTSIMSTFLSVAAELEAKSKKVQEEEALLAKREVEHNKEAKILAQRETRVKTQEETLAKRETNLIEREVRLQAQHNLMDANCKKLSERVVLNVGGQLFTTSKTTMLRSPYFDSMISTGCLIAESGVYFVDRDPRYFEVVLNCMRDGKIRTGGFAATAMEELRHELNFFQLFGFPNEIPQSSIDALRSWLPKKSFMLVYKASRDGREVADFDRACCGKGPTLTIIQAEDGNLFGAYGPSDRKPSTNGSIEFRDDAPESFIFSLTNPHSIPPTRFAQKNPGVPTRGDLTLGGEGIVWISFPQQYTDTTERGKRLFCAVPDEFFGHSLRRAASTKTTNVFTFAINELS